MVKNPRTRQSQKTYLKSASIPRKPLNVAFDLHKYLTERRQMIELALRQTVAEPDGPAARLLDAMRYSLLAGGKRLRPILALAACEAVGGAAEHAMGFACALEMIHSYSMIHDDLPCMDDDDLRHGKPTNHKIYGEAIATLAGDALLTDAFRVLARSRKVAPQVLVEVVAELSEAAGSAGMVGGQTIDILAEGRPGDIGKLEYMHHKKTGALFLAALRGGALIGGANNIQIESLTIYGRKLGLAFQVVDDVLDVAASTEQMGKRTNKDSARGKVTYPSLLGLEMARGLAKQLKGDAIEALDGFDHKAEPLRGIARFIVERDL